MTKMLGAMLEGSLVSLEIFFLTLLFALPLALPVALGRMSASRWVRGPIHVYILVMRGTPLILQLIFVYFAPYYLFDASFDRFTAVIVFPSPGAALVMTSVFSIPCEKSKFARRMRYASAPGGSSGPLIPSPFEPASRR